MPSAIAERSGLDINGENPKRSRSRFSSSLEAVGAMFEIPHLTANVWQWRNATWFEVKVIDIYWEDDELDGYWVLTYQLLNNGGDLWAAEWDGDQWQDGEI